MKFFRLVIIAVKGIKDHKGVTVADCVGWLKDDLSSGAIISADQGAPYRLDLAITYMNPGSAAKRRLPTISRPSSWKGLNSCW